MKRNKIFTDRIKKRRMLTLLFTITLIILGTVIFKAMFNIKANKDIKQASAKINEQIINENKDKQDKEKKEKEEKEKEQNKTLPIKGKNYSQVGQPFADDPAKVQKMIKTGKNDGKKVAYLTFDDGPSVANTSKILDILKEKEVKATFFIMGQQLTSSKDADVIKREIAEGHAIGNHTFSHDYHKLYPGRYVDVNSFMEDVEKTNNKLKEILGQDFHTNVVRMPGGHMSWKGTDKLDKVFEEKQYYSIDWNVENGDAKPKKRNSAELFEFFKSTIGDNEAIVVLMHDTQGKQSTVEALPSIIDYLKKEGYEFRTIG